MNKQFNFWFNGLFIIFIFLFLFVNNSVAETFALKGTVLDAETGEPLRGATVQLVEIPKGTFTDPQGNFRLLDIPLSKFSLKVSYIGYQTKIISDIEKEKLSDLKIALYPEIKATQEVTVEATRVLDNQEALLVQKKKSSKIFDGISVQEISRLPAGDVGQALRRVSGVTLFNNLVIVRGVNERYNNAVLNGSQLPSTETDKKAFSFDMIPTDFVENVMVIKSYTPDLPANFAGGLVDISTNDFPSEEKFKFTITTKSNSNTAFKNDKFRYYRGGKYDWLGFDDGSRALPSDFPRNRLEMNTLLSNANNPFDTTNAKERFSQIMQSFNSSNVALNSKTITPLENQDLNLFYSKTFSLGSFDLGMTAVGNYENSYQVVDLVRNSYLSDFDTLYHSSGSESLRRVQLGGMLNIGLRNENNIFTLKGNYSNNAEDEVLILEGRDVGYQYLEFKSFSMHYTQKALASVLISGNHNLNSIQSNLDWSINYSNAIRKEPDYRRFRFSRQLSDVEYDPSTPFFPEILATQQGDGTRAGRFFSDMLEHIVNSKFNFTKEFGTTKIKFGAYYNRQKRNFNARSITITASPYLAEDVYERLTHYWALEDVLAKENFRYDDGLRLGEDSKLSDSYNAEETHYAGYIMFDALAIRLNDVRLRIIGGARIENNRLNLNSYDINNDPINIDYKTNDILPALNLIFSTSSNWNIRLAASRTLARPSYREFAPFAFYDYNSLTLVQGNPNLKRSSIWNFDLRYEIFPDISEIFSVGVFYKIFENAIEETVYPQQSELTRTFANAEGIARNFGVEFEFRKNLGFIADFFNNFQFSANLTLISSKLSVNQGNIIDERPMWGQSPYTLNLGLFYQNPTTRTSFAVGYYTFGKRIVQVAKVGVYQTDDPHIYELPTHNIDLSISQKVGVIDFKLSVSNLLNSTVIFEQSGRKYASNYKGSTISFGISYSPF